MIRILRVSFALVLFLTATRLALGQQPNTTDPLVRMLVTKGVLTETEGNAITSSGTVAEQRDRLAVLLREKGIISAAEYDAVHTVVPVGETVALSAKPTAPKAEPAQPPTEKR